MKKKEAWKYLNKQWKKMYDEFKRFTLTRSPEALHRFRVQVKKIRSFLTLLQAGKKNNNLFKTFGPVKKVFKSAGIIRDAFVHNKQAKDNDIHLPELYKEQETLQENETNKLINKQKKNLKKIKRVEKELHTQLHGLTQDELKSFFTRQISAAQKLLNRHSFTEQLHNGRKMLKHLMYNKHIIPGDLSKNMDINLDYIDDMQQTLGEWHDNKLALAFFSPKLSAEELQSLNKKKEELEKVIISKANGFSQKAKA